MRARLAILVSGIPVELREIKLKNKPPEMLTLSPKGTVPVLQLENGKVLDESLLIMHWALKTSGLDKRFYGDDIESAERLIQQNDNEFKGFLDRYKYAVRFPEKSMSEYRTEGEKYLNLLDKKLKNNPFLFGLESSFADLAIFPFVRQFAFVDKGWFDSAPYPNLQLWLGRCLDSENFKVIMMKYPEWNQNKAQQILLGN
jgi:glutathione S-transferase